MKKILVLILIVTSAVNAYSQQLNVPPRKQNTYVWCWAATIAMVGHYLKGIPAKDCSVLSAYDRALGGPGLCCQNPRRCTRTGRIGEMKFILGRLYRISGHHYSRPLTYREIRREIDKRKPFIIALQKPGRGHVVVVSGYRPPNGVIIIDPLVGRPQLVSYQILRRNRIYGVWTQTLTTSGHRSGTGKRMPRRYQSMPRYKQNQFKLRRSQPMFVPRNYSRWRQGGHTQPALWLHCCNRNRQRVCRITVRPGQRVLRNCWCRNGFRGYTCR